MRLPPSVRYLPSRLQFALNPWLWLGILLTGIVGLYAWEYRQNPGQLPWQIGSTELGESGDSTSTDVLLESLTPEEQAVAAELDNVELLLEQLDSDVSALTTGGDTSAAASLNASGAEDLAEQGESNVERLNRYVDEYSFLGTGARGANVGSEQPQSAQTDSVLSLQPNTDELATTHALAAALAQQQNTSSATADGPAQATDPTGAAADEAPAENSPSQFSFDQPQSGVIPGSLQGLNRSFIRTTPDMSPPPGTTGYVPPASLSDFNRLNQQQPSPFGTQPSVDFSGTTPALPNRSQALPPTEVEGTAPLDTPAFNNAPQVNQNEPRNGWERFWD
ncbi:MAG: hypothetical protein ACFB2W_09690 [Leptolyngbyaceae cyanobacterium]